MNKYINTFATSGDYETYKASSAFTTPNVAYLEDSKEVAYENKVEKDWSQEYLTFEALEDGTFTLSTHQINYSLDGGQAWTELAADTPTPTVTAGNKIMFKATNSGVGTFSSTGKFNAMGNPYSLLFGDNFKGKTSLFFYPNALSKLFSNTKMLISAENISLPAKELAQSCYFGMFSGCTSLTTAPALPATTLAKNCYFGMFDGCTSLTTAIELPATTLYDSCYNQMFYGCTSLATAPALPATTLAQSCYHGMFKGCTSLTTAPVLPATTLAQNCYSGMFSGCTSLTTATELPATTLAKNCYQYMFAGCTSLNYVKMLATDVSATSCLNNWVNRVSSTGTFVKHPNANLPSGASGIPEGWTVQTATE